MLWRIFPGQQNPPWEKLKSCNEYLVENVDKPTYVTDGIIMVKYILFMPVTHIIMYISSI